MHTLMFLSQTLEATRQAVDRLREQGLAEDSYSVIGKHEGGLARHHLHLSGVWERTDLVHSGEQGVIAGAFVGLLFAALMLWLQPFGVAVAWQAVVVSILIFCAFGAWVGGMIGLSHENYKLAPFHEALESGQFLLLVGVRDAAGVRHLSAALANIAGLRLVKDDDGLPNPFQRQAGFDLQH